MTLTDVVEVSGQAGAFTVTLEQRPRYVNEEKCIACGQCAEKCPQKAPDEYDQGLGVRKAIYVKYPQAVPLKFQIDPERCLKLTEGRCGTCEKVCPAGAIDFSDTARQRSVRVGSLILTPGFRPFSPRGIRTWGYDQFPNVITSLELERYLAAAGPTEGSLIRPSDGGRVRRLAFLQCVGSRDVNKAGHAYCSGVCCMYAIKEAMIALDHEPDLEISVFFVDIRTHGKDFERYYQRAKEAGIKFHRCRVHTLEPADDKGAILLRYITDRGKQVGAEFDLVVLSVGLETSPSTVELARLTGVKLNRNRFVTRSCFAPVTAQGTGGVFVAGCFAGPHDIPQSVTEASAAAAAAVLPLAKARGSLTRTKEFPPPRVSEGEAPRVGVFVCHCGSNIAGVVDVSAVAAYAAGLPAVVHVEENLFSCSQDSQERIRQIIDRERLNRVVVAACTPRTHEALFRETLKDAGLNECFLEMANIRNQDSWVHAGQPEMATDKARDLVRMAVAKVTLARAAQAPLVEVNHNALVVGGGLTGITVALGLAEQGFPVHLVEKSPRLGGNALHLYKTWKNEAVRPGVDRLVAQVKDHPLINVYLESRIKEAEGFVGNFVTTVETPDGPLSLEHGVTVLAVGGQPYRPVEYGYGQSRRVYTTLEFDTLHALGDHRVKKGHNFVFIQCVGSREPERPYCSRVCCTHSVQAAIELKEENPERNVFILYRDMRTYGQREELYQRARELGVVFINYEMHEKPVVELAEPDRVEVLVWDHVLHEPLRLPADVLVLATAIVPHPETAELARIYKLSQDADGFMLEAHSKLRPVDFASDGMFMAGLAHYPKPIEESLTQAQAAVARAQTVLAQRTLDLEPIKAMVNPELCDGCALCLDVCPYGAITLLRVAGEGEGDEGKLLVQVAPAKCKGCGSCQATCPKEGIDVAGFSYRQLSSQVAAALSG